MVRMDIEVDGLKPLLRRIGTLPKTAQDEIREAARAIADDEAARISSAGRSSDKQSRAAAGFVRSRRDRVPMIVAGGSSKVGVSGGATAGQLFFGAEFGGQGKKNWDRLTETKTSRSGKTREVFAGVAFAGARERVTTAQFRPHKGKTGYWMWPQLREDEARMLRRWVDVVEAVAREWGRG